MGSQQGQANFHRPGDPNARWCCAPLTVLPAQAAAWPTNAALRLWCCRQGSCARKQEWPHSWWKLKLLKCSVVLVQDIATVTGKGVWEQLRWRSPCYRAEAALAHFVVFNSAWQVSPLRICCRAFGIDVNVHSCCKVLHTLAVYYVKNCLPFFELDTNLVWWPAGLALEETLNSCSLFAVFVSPMIL